MATTKLTLSIEPDMIAKAKRYASKHHISVSKLFSDLINDMVENEDPEKDPLMKKIREMKVSDNVKALTGILKGKVPDNFDHKDAKRSYLNNKYGL